MPALDTLFLGFPLSFKGRVVQYAGRVLRVHEDKTDLDVHDYLDTLLPVLKAMHAKATPYLRHPRVRHWTSQALTLVANTRAMPWEPDALDWNMMRLSA